MLQTAWVQNLSIKENIVFGTPYDEAKYADVIHACALEQDLQMLPLGDASIGGLRGMNLSGGQRQRVNIARAAYFDADTILLDNALRCALFLPARWTATFPRIQAFFADRTELC